jgi:hypothetical protein
LSDICNRRNLNAVGFQVLPPGAAGAPENFNLTFGSSEGDLWLPGPLVAWLNAR